MTTAIIPIIRMFHIFAFSRGLGLNQQLGSHRLRAGRHRRLQLEILEGRRLLVAAPFEAGGLGYFPATSNGTIERFDPTSEQWLEPIVLADASVAADVVHVDDGGIYAAFGKTVYRYDATGGAREHLFNAPYAVVGLHSDGDILFVNHTAGLSASLTSIDKTTNTVVDTFNNYIDSVYGSSIAITRNRIFGVTNGISPADIAYVSYNAAGYFSGGDGTRYHGDYAIGTRTWVSDGDRYVIDSQGHLYTTDSLMHAGRLGAEVTDIGFIGDSVPIVLADDELTVYTSGFLPGASIDLEQGGDELLLNESTAFVFSSAPTSPHGYSVQAVSLAALQSPQPAATVDPVDLPYTPSDFFLANDGTVLLLSKEHQSLFRWDPAAAAYTQSIRLLGTPSYVAYSQKLDVLYTAYDNGLIRKIDFVGDSLAETPFAQLPAAPLGLVAAETYLIAEDGSGAWSTLNTISSGGDFVDSRDWHYPSSGLIWSEHTQEIMYFSGFSPSDLHARRINADGSEPELRAGGIGKDRNTPLHGSSLIRKPVRISPDGSIAILGSGAVFDVEQLAPTAHSLGNTVVDITWVDDTIVTARNIAGVSQIQRWTGSSFGLDGVVQFEGEAVALLPVREDSGLFIRLDSEGVPQFELFNAMLEPVVVSSQLRLKPSITWSTPEPILSYDSLTAVQLSAEADVPGEMWYTPPLGTFLPPGEHELSVRFVPDDLLQYREVTRTIGIEVLGVDFGNAPDQVETGFAQPYPVMLDQDGARHIIDPSIRLGQHITPDPTTGSAGMHDEDGVKILASLFATGHSMSSSVEVVTHGSGYLSAWIDFNRDGDWDDVGEHVVNDQVSTGPSLLATIFVPANLSAGETVARFRFSSQQGLQPVGLAVDGEVEDYVIDVLEVGQPVELLPINGEPIVIEYQSDYLVYRHRGRTIASYPKVLFNIQDFNGVDADESILINERLAGDLVLTGDAGAGHDRIKVTGDGQNFDFVAYPTNGIRNVEEVDLTPFNDNRVRLDQASLLQLTGGVGELTLHQDATDTVLLQGDWQVEAPRESALGPVHSLRSGDALLHLYNAYPRRNPLIATDVDFDGETTTLDALLVIKYLNAVNRADRTDETVIAFRNYLDVSGDNHISPWDAIHVINRLNRMNRQIRFDQTSASGESVPIDSWQADFIWGGRHDEVRQSQVEGTDREKSWL